MRYLVINVVQPQPDTPKSIRRRCLKKGNVSKLGWRLDENSVYHIQSGPVPFLKPGSNCSKLPVGARSDVSRTPW